MTIKINIHFAKTHLSELLKKAESGEEIIIAKAGKPIAKLVGLGPEKPLRTPGTAQGAIIVSDDFDAPLPEDILRDFNV
jgi:prevent-host-death family protein